LLNNAQLAAHIATSMRVSETRKQV